MREPNKNGFFADDIDLGDADFAALPDFTGDDLADIFAAESTQTEEHTNETLSENAAPEAGETHAPEAADAPATEPDLFSAAVVKADEKQAADEKIRLTAKLPIFSYADVKEEISDPSMTFDACRSEKAEDFPELDDAAKRKRWQMCTGRSWRKNTASMFPNRGYRKPVWKRRCPTLTMKSSCSSWSFTRTTLWKRDFPTPTTVMKPPRGCTRLSAGLTRSFPTS